MLCKLPIEKGKEGKIRAPDPKKFTSVLPPELFRDFVTVRALRSSDTPTLAVPLLKLLWLLILNISNFFFRGAGWPKGYR